ncbi:ribosomal protein S5 domain 2-type protein [Usnea florida]
MTLNSNPQPLTYPALTFAKLAPTSFLSTHLTNPKGPVRPSGRTPTQTRPPACNTGSLTHANGSAVVRFGDTAVVCGVRGEILKVGDIAHYVARDLDVEEDGDDDEEKRDEGTEDQQGKSTREDAVEMAQLNLLVPNLELATGCSPAHLPGGPPSVLAQTLTQRVMILLHTSNMIGMRPLRIWFRPPEEATGVTTSGVMRLGGDMEEMDARHGNEEEEMAKAEIKAFWVLYIDVLFISLDGNAFDAAWLAILAALKDTVLPRAWWDADREMVLCSDDPVEAKRLDIRNLPVPLSFGVFNGDGRGLGEWENGQGKQSWVLVDMDGFEEGLCREEGTVVVRDGGRLVRIEKSGGAGVGMAEMRWLVELAAKRRKEWMEVLGIK